MWQNIFKIGIILSVTIIASSERPLRISTTLLNGFQDNIDTEPFIKLDGKLYYFGQEKLSWYDAFLTCGSMGGSLASIDNAEELIALSNVLTTRYNIKNWWWLSGSDNHKEGNFYWYGTYKPIKYADWSFGQPDNNGGNENCVHLWHKQTKFQMNDWGCRQLANYICETKNPKTLAVTWF